MGRRRVSHYTPRIGKDICAHIAAGCTLQKALDKVGYLAPTINTVWKWLDEHEDFRASYDRARSLQADTDADRMREMGEEVIANPQRASAYRVAIGVLEWQAERRNRAKYGARAEEDKRKTPMNAAALRAEIKRLEAELGIQENGEPAKKPFTVVFPNRPKTDEPKAA